MRPLRSAPGPAAPGPDRRETAAPPHALSAAEALQVMQSIAAGLSQAEAERRLGVYGPNRLPEARRRSFLLRFARHFHSLLIYVLLGAAALAAVIGHVVDAAVILAVVLVNATIGFVQEGRAEAALQAIRSMIDPRASVLRGGGRVTVQADAVVPGDLVLIEAGDRVPADLRLIRTAGLRIDESVLTGESVPVEKDVEPAPADAPLGDRTSMAFSGTLVAAGQGAGVVIATGAATELGRISQLIEAVGQLATPLVRQMNHFARQVTVAVAAVSALVFAYASLAQGYRLEEAFMAVVGLAVAAIPEGLPAVMTIALAVGVQRMARRNAIIRRLPAVETLGSVTVICSDKTGTLTRNEMLAAVVETGARRYAVDGVGYGPEGRFLLDHSPADPRADPVLQELCLAALLCNDAAVRRQVDEWVVDGDPMEGALIALSGKAGLGPSARDARPRLAEIPFDPKHRYMATLHASAGGARKLYVKGAPERVLRMCAEVAGPDGDAPLELAQWQARTEALAFQGLRVIGLAVKEMPPACCEISAAEVEGGLRFLGLVGLIDPPRPEAMAALLECRAAGVAVKMITGDHPATAGAIALQLGLADGASTVTGLELDALDDAEFRRQARESAVFARTSPEHKLRLVEALQSDGSVVAMTGDGVNDAPALKRADVGIAMGRRGSEAAKQASEMVLADDNFSSIVAAVREGRTVYDNLTKVITWTLPTNGGEAFTIVLAILFGLSLPVTPVQILWINMLTAVALGLTLAFEPTEPNAMRRSPRRAGAPLLSGRLLWRVLFVSALMVAGAFGVFAWAQGRGLDTATARTMVVNALVVMEIFYLFSVRYVGGSSLTWRGALGTPAVLLGITAVTIAQFAFTYAPPLQALFGSRPVPLVEGVAIVLVGVALLLVVEVEKRVAALTSSGRRAFRYGRPRMDSGPTTRRP